MPNGDPGTFGRAEYIDLTPERLIADSGGRLSMADAKKLHAQMSKEVLYRSEHYQVAIDKSPTHGFKGTLVWHLSIKRNDREPIHDWRDLQAIKNILCGEEVEAFELYPSEARKVDSANQFHLWAFMKHGKDRRPMLPIGWTQRFVTDEPWVNGGQRTASKQREFNNKQENQDNGT